MQDLENIPFFNDLSREQYALLSPLFEPFTVPARTVIFKQGDTAAFLYIILKGSVTIEYKPYDGPKITLTRLNRGDIFGWSSVVGSSSYTSDAISTTKAETLRIRGADLKQLYSADPKVSYSLLEKLAEAVSPRWINAKNQIQNMLQNNFYEQE